MPQARWEKRRMESRVFLKRRASLAARRALSAYFSVIARFITSIRSVRRILRVPKPG